MNRTTITILLSLLSSLLFVACATMPAHPRGLERGHSDRVVERLVGPDIGEAYRETVREHGSDFTQPITWDELISLTAERFNKESRWSSYTLRTMREGEVDELPLRAKCPCLYLVLNDVDGRRWSVILDIDSGKVANIIWWPPKE